MNTNRPKLTYLLSAAFVGSLALIVTVGWSAPTVPALTPDATPGVWAAPADDVNDDGLDQPRGALLPREEAPPKLTKLTPKQINRIRYLELRGMRFDKLTKPDRVSVKIDRDVIRDFLLEMDGHEDFRGKKNRRDFLVLTAPQKLNVIAHYRGAAYADRVEIKTDPEVFKKFRQHVMPIVIRSCATNGCHAPGNAQAVAFRLFKDPKRSASTTYANFIILNELEAGPHQMINRAQPEESLLLSYLLADKNVKPDLRHPGNIDMKPAFQKRKALGYVRIKQWIESLKNPAEDYGVHILKQEEEEQAAADEKSPDKGQGDDKNKPAKPKEPAAKTP